MQRSKNLEPSQATSDGVPLRLSRVVLSIRLILVTPMR